MKKGLKEFKSIIKIIEFYLGLALLIVTSICYLNKAIVYSGMLNQLIIGKFSVYSLFIVLPFTIGIVYIFYHKKKDKKGLIALIYTAISALLLIISTIICISFASSRFSKGEYIILILIYIVSAALITISKIHFEEKKYVK